MWGTNLKELAHLRRSFWLPNSLASSDEDSSSSSSSSDEAGVSTGERGSETSCQAYQIQLLPHWSAEYFFSATNSGNIIFWKVVNNFSVCFGDKSCEVLHFYYSTCDVEEDAVVPEGGAWVQARVGQLHSLNLQLAIADTRVFSVHYCPMVFGPVDSIEGLLGRATEIQTIPEIEGEQLCWRFHRD